MTENILKELRTSFTQFLYGYYEELNKKYSQETAKKLTYQVVLEILEPFMDKQPESISYYSLLSDWEKEWINKEKEAIQKKDYDIQEQAIDILMALKVLIPYAKVKDNVKSEDNEE